MRVLKVSERKKYVNGVSEKKGNERGTDTTRVRETEGVDDET